MILSENDYKEFLTTHFSLLFFAGLKKNIIPKKITLEKFRMLDMKIKFKCRESLYQNEYLIEEYIASNFDNLTENQINIILGFKKRITGHFVIYKCLKNYAVFLNSTDDRFYAVKALRDPFDHFFSTFPVIIKTVILPFNHQIIYDGFIESSGLYCGRNMTANITEEYRKAKLRKEILSSLE